MLIALAVLLIVSAFFSIAETSMMALNRYRLRHLVKEGSKAAILTSRLLGNTDKLLGVILLGNNLINAASATLVTVIAVRLLGDSEWVLSIATVSVTFLILVFAEITPKVIGASYPERIALGASFVLSPLLKLAYPIVWFVNLFVAGLIKVLRIKRRATDEGAPLSMEELRTLVMEGGHYIPAKHRNILGNLFELEDITVDDVMTPRPQIEAIDIDAPIEEIRERLAMTNHTRLPMYAGSLDNVIGILHMRKVLHQTRSGELSRETLREILRAPYFIPEGTPLFTQLQNFQEGRRRLGLVVDEYGEMQGLLTLEDILEEIVGEFTSNSPSRGGLVVSQDDGSILVEGRTPLRLLNRRFGLNFPLDGPKTINGLILERLEDIPEPGTSLKISGCPVEIVQTQDRMVRMVRIYHNIFVADETLPASSRNTFE
ncbi:MAG: HlyC/CorC family transporter [Burkholderiales bacterium]|nr:HlyC/CorC family transporter [Burkholderiales bacterium]